MTTLTEKTSAELLIPAVSNRGAQTNAVQSSHALYEAFVALHW